MPNNNMSLKKATLINSVMNIICAFLIIVNICYLMYAGLTESNRSQVIGQGMFLIFLLGGC